MALVRITHADGTVETIRTRGAIEEINVQQGDRVENLGETLPSPTAENGPETASDIEPEDDPITIVQVTNGTDFIVGDTVGDGVNPVGIVGIAGDHGTLFMFSNGFYEYDLNKKDPRVQSLSDGESLSDVFSYAINYGGKEFDTDTLTIAIRGTRKGPRVCNDDHAVDIAMISTATDAGDDMANTESVPQGNSDGLSVIGHTGGDKYGMLTLNVDGSYDYKLDVANSDVIALGDGETLREVYTYKASDGVNVDTATLTVTITGTNDGPAIVNTTH